MSLPEQTGLRQARLALSVVNDALSPHMSFEPRDWSHYAVCPIMRLSVLLCITIWQPNAHIWLQPLLQTHWLQLPP